METKKINDVEVKPVKVTDLSKIKVLGGEMMPTLYGNLFILAKKKSGKTCTIAKILAETTDPDTTVYFFCSTIDNDETYKAITEDLEKRKVPFQIFKSIEDRERSMRTLKSGESRQTGPFVKINHLEAVVDELSSAESSGNGYAPPINQTTMQPLPSILGPISAPSANPYQVMLPVGGGLRFVDGIVRPTMPALTPPTVVIEHKGRGKQVIKDDSGREKKPKKKAYHTPKAVFVFDDLGKTLRNGAVANLMKKNRHLKSRVIVSSQDLHDLTPEAIRQLDYIFMFGGLPEDKVETVHKQLDLALALPAFKRVYKFATAEKYHFLYVDVRDESYRRDFNTEIRPRDFDKDD